MSNRCPSPGLADRLREGVASAEERDWAVRRMGVLEEDRTAVELTWEQEWELAALRLLLGVTDG